MRKTVTIVIPHYRAETLVDCLRSIFGNSSWPIRVIVVDDGGNAPSLQTARREFPDIEVIENDGNRGFSYSCNRGLGSAQTEYSVLLNDDTLVTKDWLGPLVATADADTSIAACQPKLLSATLKNTFDYSGGAGGYIDRWGYTFCRGRVLDSVERDEGQYDSPTDVFWACGSALFVRTEAVRRVGLMDLDFFMHFEEIDLCWRLRLAGYRLVAVPGSIVFHHAGWSLPFESYRKSYLNHRNNLVMLFKNLPFTRLMWLMPARMILELAAAINYLISGRSQLAAAPVAAIAWCLFHPLSLIRRRQNSRAVCVPGAKVDRRGVYEGSILVQYFLRRRRRCSSFMAEEET